uniref:Uncharacterized protein n=1 Tax=Anopheles atroparvus TaxID=41427 RepID=A0A182IM90_ANOAO
MKSIFIIFCVAALANAMTVNRQQQQVPPQQVGQGGQHQARQEQDNQPPIPSQQQMQGWQNRQQQQVGQRQEDQPPMPDQQQLHGGQNRQQQQTVTEENWQLLVKCLDMDCQAERILQRQQQLQQGQNRQQQQVVKGGQQQVGPRQEDQPPVPGQQQMQGWQNRQQQQVVKGGQQQVGPRQEDQPPVLGQQQMQGWQNRQQQQKWPQQVGQQQVGQRQVDCGTDLCLQMNPLRQQQSVKTRQEVECNELDCPGIEYWSGTQRQDEHMYTYCQEIPKGTDPYCDQLLGDPEPRQYTDEQSGIHVDEIIHANFAEVVLPIVLG